MKWRSLILIALFPQAAFSQAVISGRVVSEKDQPVAGASVFVPNTAIGTSTNSKGEFSLSGVPKGNFKIAVSCIGYETFSANVLSGAKAQRYSFTLQPKVQEMESVVIAKYDKGGWAKWGRVFSEAFVGTSAYAEDCVITNANVVNFVFSEGKDQLRAYAGQPLIIHNRALGYVITVELVDFVYDLSGKQVDYQLYSFFQPMTGTEDEEVNWKKNRREAYAYSLMHFMRAVYADNLKGEGFELRMTERKMNTEKRRVQELYKKEFAFLKDSLNKKELREAAVTKMIERRFSKDSLRHYKKVLEEEDMTQTTGSRPLTRQQVAVQNDSSVVLSFSNYLTVTYTKRREPAEYFAYRQQALAEQRISPFAPEQKRDLPSTVLYLVQNIPVEISETGYFNNIDLLVDGFWGWWEKLSTKLPYDYTP